MEKEQNQKHGPSHMLIMLICCLVPILLILALVKFGISSRTLFLLLILLCPLGHFFMMRGGHKGHKQEGHNQDKEHSRD